MGRRRKSAPKRGSLAYSPRKRANGPVGRIRHWPDVDLDSPVLLGFSGYKVGMSHVYQISDVRGSPKFGQEVISPITVVETAPLLVCGVRGYSSTSDGLKAYKEAWAEGIPEAISPAPLNQGSPPTSMSELEASLARISEFRAIVSTQPWLANVSQKRPEIFEVKAAGGSMSERLKYLRGILGGEVEVSDVFQEGQFIDVISVTKGRGIQGPVKRWGVKKRQHKSRKTVRGVASLGPWRPSYVMYTVPRAGQTGFHQRTERNKRILKLNVKGEDINPDGGFPHYGVIRSSGIFLKGSIPGPAKRLIKMRYAEQPPSRSYGEQVNLTYIDIPGAQINL